MASEWVEVASVPFLKFVANKGTDDAPADYSFVLRGYVHHWLTNVWREFDRIGLTDLVSSSGSARIDRKLAKTLFGWPRAVPAILCLSAGQPCLG